MTQMELTQISNESISSVSLNDDTFQLLPVVPGRVSPPRQFHYCANGQAILHLESSGCSVLNQSKVLINEFKIKNLVDAQLSPNGKYLSTWERYVKPEGDAEQCKNLTIYDVNTAKPLISLLQKSQNGWNVQWSDNELFFGRLVNGHVNVYDSKTFTLLYKIQPDDQISSFAFAPGASPTLCCFTSEQKDKPASLKLFLHLAPNAPLSQKTFFRADSATIHWNRTGSAVLVLTHTDTDKTGQSYYGETNLYFMTADGSYDCRVALDKAGPVHDVHWSPNAIHFAVIYGTMPSKATLFGAKAEQVYQFPPSARNYTRFDPTGRMLLIAGFGNLAGDLDIWDLKTMKKGLTMKASNASVCEWSPDGRFFMTATLYKRLKVDNGLKVYTHTGKLAFEHPLKELHQIAWQPTEVDKFARRALDKFDGVDEAAVKAVYRPPGARGQPASSVFSADSNGLPPADRPRTVPGQRSKPPAKHAAAPQAPVQVIPDVICVDKEKVEKEKKIKVCMKKLKQIEDLKVRVKNGEMMELTQLSKIQNEDAVRTELDNLHL